MEETRPANYPKLENYTPTRFMLPTSHYDEKKADRAVRFIENLRHTKSKWAGQRFWLLPWQEQIIRDIFGVVKEDGTRQFRTAFVEIPKKQGKLLEIGTPIPTPNGFTAIGDLKVGDTVYDGHGDPCHIVAKSEIDDTEQAYRLTFKDGSTIVAGERHLWNVEVLPEHEDQLCQTGELYRMEGKLLRIPVAEKFYKGGEKYHIITSIEPLPEKVQMQCIQVDSPSHQYLAGPSMVPTHNSELAAAVALYMLYADGEASPEVYGAAADRQQASIVFDVAKRMVEMSPALLKRSKILAAQKRLVNYGSAGFYQVLSAEVGCVMPDTIIQMEDGSLKRAAEVHAGDRILAFDGMRPVFDEVASVQEEEPEEVLEITTRHNRKTCVTRNHPFWAMMPGRRMQDLTHVYDWVTAENLQKNTRLAVALGWPETSPPADGISTLEAWALGAWAGDGDCTHFRLINPDQPVIEKMDRFMHTIGSSLKSTYSTRQKQAGKDAYQGPIEHQIMGVGKRTKSPGREWVRQHFGQKSTAHTKKIPDVIWTGGPDVWAAFLAGYLDTDGCSGKATPDGKFSTTVSICSVSEDMTKGCQILLERLGINASTRRKLNVAVSGKPQLQRLWHLLCPYMVHERKRQRLQELAELPIERLQRANESDKVAEIRSLGMQRTISFEMKTYQTHATDGLITHNTKHGLNVSGLILDEIHAYPNRNLYDVLTKGASDARQNPLSFIITTAGNDRNSIGFEVHTKAKDILDGRRVDPTFYPVIYGIDDDDDWADEKNWYKANPSLDITVPIDRMRDAFRDAQQNPVEENLFRSLRLCQWTSATVRWIPEYIYDLGDQPIDMKSLEGRDCYGGLDLSSSEDITAFVLMFPPRTADEKYILLPFMWVPEDTIPQRVRSASIPYDTWVKHKYLMVTPGNVIDYGYIEHFIDELGKKYHICEIAYDRWGAVEMVQHLEGEGFTVVPFGQGYKDMSPPTKAFYELLMKGDIVHGGHPVLRWMAGNVVVETDAAGNIKVTKKRSVEKVDGIVAAIMALDRCIRHENTSSIYDSRDMVVI